jgi:hypothetical protein
VSHAAMYSEALFWFSAVLTLLLVTFIGVMVRTPPGTVGSLRLPEFDPPAPPPAMLANAAGPSARTGYQPRHALAPKPERTLAGRPPVSAGPPWGPAPKPPDLGPLPHAVRAQAGRQAHRHGAHRARVSAGRAHRSASQTGRHRTGGAHAAQVRHP